MIIDCISDLHGYLPVLEGGDLLIVAGDLTGRDHVFEYKIFFEWLKDQEYTKKVLVAGNHDNLLNKNTHTYRKQNDIFDWIDGCDFLLDSGTEFEYEEEVEEDHKFMGTIKYKCKKKLKIWGSPWVMYFPGMNEHCAAFTCIAPTQMMEKWELIPNDTDILITHSPQMHILDKTCRKYRVGCPYLYQKIKQLQPKLHVCGHIHENHGTDMHGATICVNASLMDQKYRPINNPIRIIL